MLNPRHMLVFSLFHLIQPLKQKDLVMQAEIIVKGKTLGGSSDLTLLAPIMPGFIEALETVTYKTRVKKVLAALHASRQSSHEYATARLLSDSIERVGAIQSVRVAVLEPEDKVMLVVSFDGNWESYIRVLWHKVGSLLDLIFCSTEGYVTSHDHSFEEWMAWAKRVQVESHFFYGSPEFTARDALFHRRIERTRMRGLSSELNEIRSVLPSSEEIAERVGEPSQNIDDGQFGVDRFHLTYEKLAIGFSGLARLYQLTDLFQPNTSDGRVLRCATINLLSEWVMMWNDGLAKDKFDDAQGIKPHHSGRFKRQMNWIFPAGTLKPLEIKHPKPADDYEIDGFKDEVQGGIVESYTNITHGVVLLLSFENAKACVGFISAIQALLTKHSDAKQDKVRYNLAFTIEGLRACGLSEDEIELFPEDFRQGMAARAGLLGDVRNNHPRRWRLPVVFDGFDKKPKTESYVPISSVHAVLQLRIAAKTDEQKNAIDYWDTHHPLKSYFNSLPAGNATGAKVLAVQSMKRQFKGFESNGKTTEKPVEHFGYAEGDSDLKFVLGAPLQNKASLGEVLLGHNNAADDDTYNMNSPASHGTKYEQRMEWLRNGSFLVLRKYRQFVDRFEEVVNEGAETLGGLRGKEAANNLNAEKQEVYAKLMGRYQNGKALAQATSESDINHFSYDDDNQGQRCPLHAHIRRANPRVEAGKDMARPPRLVRRSMSYGSVYDKDKTKNDERGLVFMAYNASISEQFEVVQRWLVAGNSTGASSGISCPIVGVPENGYERHYRFESTDVSDGKGNACVINIALETQTPLFDEPQPFTQLEWGMYLFTPSIPVLRKLQVVAEAASRLSPASRSVPWSLQRGREILAKLQHLEATLPAHCAIGSWKAAIEDPEAIDRLDSAALWAAIREDHGGVLRTSYGVLVADRDLVSEVYLDDHERYSVSGQMERMIETIGPIALGRDMGDAYRREADPINKAIMAIEPKTVFDLAFEASKKKLEKVIRQVKENAQAVTAPSYELSIDARELLTEVLADLSEYWFGIQGSKYFERGNADWGWDKETPPIYPGHFTALSRYMFQPNPSDVPKQHAIDYGNALSASMRKFVDDLKGKVPRNIKNEEAPITKAIFGHDNGNTLKTNPKFIADTMVGVLMGFTPTIIGAVLNVLKEWHNENLFDQLRADAKGVPIKNYDDAYARLHKPMARAAQMRPMPAIGWRTVRKAHTLGDTAKHAVSLNVGDKVVMAMVSATQQSLEDGKDDGRLMFGGVREQSNDITKPLTKHPTHACPGYHAGIAAMLGTITALLNCKENLRQGTTPTVFDVKETLEYPANNNVSKLKIADTNWASVFVQGLKNKFENYSNFFKGQGAGKGLILAWGDSWLDYTEYSPGADLADELFRIGYLVNDMQSADEVSPYCSYKKWLLLETMATDCKPSGKQSFLKFVSKKLSNNPRAILLSGGGNDSVGDALLGFVNPTDQSNVSKINPKSLREHLDKIIKNYTDIVSAIQGLLGFNSKRIPIAIHGYDYPVPLESELTVINLYQNDWIRKPLMKTDGYSYSQEAATVIMNELITALNTRLKEFAKKSSNVIYVNIRGSLAAVIDDQSQACWRDNLHPNAAGFKKMANEISRNIEDWHRANP
jgi:Dyp-type peroxidase family